MGPWTTAEFKRNIGKAQTGTDRLNYTSLSSFGWACDLMLSWLVRCIILDIYSTCRHFTLFARTPLQSFWRNCSNKNKPHYFNEHSVCTTPTLYPHVKMLQLHKNNQNGVTGLKCKKDKEGKTQWTNSITIQSCSGFRHDLQCTRDAQHKWKKHGACCNVHYVSSSSKHIQCRFETYLLHSRHTRLKYFRYVHIA